MYNSYNYIIPKAGASINRLADKIIELVLCTKRVSDTDNGTFSLKERLLFCLSQSPQPPRELMDSLGMVKSNLAILAKKCINEGLIEKRRLESDGRALMYSLTDKGRAEIEEKLDKIEKKFASVLTSESERKTAEEELDNVISLLSYIP